MYDIKGIEEKLNDNNSSMPGYLFLEICIEFFLYSHVCFSIHFEVWLWMNKRFQNNMTACEVASEASSWPYLLSCIAKKYFIECLCTYRKMEVFKEKGFEPFSSGYTNVLLK